MVTLYNVVSEDGYIADKNGSEHFIPDRLWPTTLNLFKKYDALVMGRKTYDAMQKYPRELLKPFEKLSLKKVVVTSNKKDFHPNPQLGYVVVHSPQDALSSGTNVLVSSGPTLNTFFLKNNLVDQVIFHKVPVNIGEGIKPFDIDMKTVLVSVSETTLEEGAKELTYQVL
ncbi:MAG: dihydrofolate reductase family protein [Candidatus Jorgensenbacteria bacterium]|nr:dihydrofolate reductase family protein [Candidatus Jorgensenbacteria bacterium]